MKPRALEESWTGQAANGQRRLGDVYKAGLGYRLLRQGRLLGWGTDSGVGAEFAARTAHSWKEQVASRVVVAQPTPEG